MRVRKPLATFALALLARSAVACGAAADPSVDEPGRRQRGSADRHGGNAAVDAASGDGGTKDAGPGITGVRILTMNLYNPAINAADADARMQMIADFIMTAQPDFVALQEVTKSGGKNRAEEIATKAGYDWRWQSAMNAGLYEEGPAVLSKSSILWSGAKALPHKDLLGTMTRQVLGVRAMTPVGEIAFYATHMFVTPDDAKKADQAAAIAAFIGEHPAAAPGFFAGDLNALPDTPAMKFFRGEEAHAGVTVKYMDAWRATHPTDPGFTHPSDAPNERIDYVYVVPGSAKPGVPASCTIVLGTPAPTSGIRASDHLGVMCDVGM